MGKDDGGRESSRTESRRDKPMERTAHGGKAGDSCKGQRGDGAAREERTGRALLVSLVSVERVECAK